MCLKPMNVCYELVSMIYNKVVAKLRRNVSCSLPLWLKTCVLRNRVDIIWILKTINYMLKT